VAVDRTGSWNVLGHSESPARWNMRIEGIAIDGIVEARIKGRTILGRVTEIVGGVVYFRPSARALVGGTQSRGRSSSTGGRLDVEAVEERGRARVAAPPDGPPSSTE
jgi:hypothetical protein